MAYIMDTNEEERAKGKTVEVCCVLPPLPLFYRGRYLAHIMNTNEEERAMGKIVQVCSVLPPFLPFAIYRKLFGLQGPQRGGAGQGQIFGVLYGERFTCHLAMQFDSALFMTEEKRHTTLDYPPPSFTSLVYYVVSSPVSLFACRWGAPTS